MQTSTGFVKLSRKDRFRTIGTSDTYDINQSDKNITNENRRQNGSIKKKESKSKKESKIWESRRHNKSLNSVFMHSRSRYRDNTPKIKIKRLMSNAHNDEKGLRIKTDYSDSIHPYSFKKMVSELKKDVCSVIDYKLDSFKILKMVYENQREEFYTAKMKVGQNQNKKYTLIKVKDGKVKGY